MEITNINDSLLSNYEVLSLIKSLPKNTDENISKFLSETVEYLKDSPCGCQSPEKLHKSLTTLKKCQFPLSKSEKLMIVNNPPTSMLQLSLIIKGWEQKAYVEQMHHLLNLIVKCVRKF